MKWVMIVAVSLLAACAAVSTPEMKSAAQTVSLGNESEHWCTGVVIGKHTVLTAEHCLAPDKPITHVQNVKMDVKVGASDGNDHVLLHTDKPWPVVAKVNLKHPELTESVYFWGYAEGGPMLFRRGYYAGHIDYPALLGPLGKSISEHYRLYDVEVIFGDSGSPIFNSRGEVVGTVNIIHHRQLVYRMMGSAPWAFTPEQWKTVK